MRHLIVVLPGIGGSVLAEPDGSSAWDVTVDDIRHAVVDPASLALDRELAPTRLTDTLTVLGPWWAVPGYDGLNHQLRTRFGARLAVVDAGDGAAAGPGIDVLRIPYDFRRSVADAADVVGRAVTAAVGGSGRQVVVVAHSMGGLVARYWIGACGGWRHCRALITLGTPHRGAPRALDWLFNGAGVGVLRSRSVTRVLRDWPGVYELAPQYPAVLSAGTPVEVDALSPDLVRPFGSPEAGARVLRGVAAAARVHRDIAESWKAIPTDHPVGLLPYFGRGHRTLHRAEVRGGRVRVGKDDPDWRGNVGWRGDGTVPAVSAIPVELSAEPERATALPDKHGAMGSTGAILEALVTLQGDALPVRGGPRPVRPWVGWDLDETVAAGAEHDVGVELQAGDGGAEDVGSGDVVGGAATVVVTGGAERVELPMGLHGRDWRARLPALPPGAYQLDVEITDAWHGTSVYASTPLAVVEPPADVEP